MKFTLNRFVNIEHNIEAILTWHNDGYSFSILQSDNVTITT